MEQDVCLPLSPSTEATAHSSPSACELVSGFCEPLSLPPFQAQVLYASPCY